MATLSASVSGKTVNYSIDSLSYNFDTSNYLSAGICLVPFTDGASSISGIVDTVTPVTYVAPTPPTYGSRLYDSGSPVPVYVAQEGYTSYSFSSSSGQYSYSGSYVTIQPSGSGTLYTITDGGTFLTKQVMSGGYVTTYWYESYVVDSGSSGVHGVTYINDSYTNATIGSYTIYAWTRRSTNSLYYLAGSQSITVWGDGAINIRIGSTWTKAYPYIRVSGLWVPVITYARNSGSWVSTE